MSRNRLPIFFILLPLLLISQRGFAQQFCTDAADEDTCVQNVNAALLKGVPLAKELTGDKAQAALNELKEQVAVPDSASALLNKISPEIAALPGASTAFDDFLNRLRIGVTTEGSDDMPDLVIDFTDFLGLAAKDGYKVQAVARNPVLDEDLSTKLSQEDRDKRTKGLGSFDDVLVSFAYSPSTLYLGNNLGANQLLIDDLFRRLLAQNEALAAKATEAKTAREKLASELSDEVLSGKKGVEFDKIPGLERRKQFRDAVERAAVAEATRLSALQTILNRAQFFKIADLVANQPQLVVKATRAVRDELVGPEETTLKVSYEYGFVNMNGLRSALAACKPEEMTTCYTGYLTERRDQLAKDQNRFTFSLDWTQQKDYRPTVDGVSLSRPGKDRWTIATTFGRNLRVDVDGNVTTRFDLKASWEDWSDDPMHQDRGVANLSFTQKVTGDMSLVLGAVWASKPEFRGQVDKAVSARFGLTYRFLDAKGKEIMRKAGQ